MGRGRPGSSSLCRSRFNCNDVISRLGVPRHPARHLPCSPLSSRRSGPGPALERLPPRVARPHAAGSSPASALDAPPRREPGASRFGDGEPAAPRPRAPRMCHPGGHWPCSSQSPWHTFPTTTTPAQFFSAGPTLILSLPSFSTSSFIPLRGPDGVPSSWDIVPRSVVHSPGCEREQFERNVQTQPSHMTSCRDGSSEATRPG